MQIFFPSSIRRLFGCALLLHVLAAPGAAGSDAPTDVHLDNRSIAEARSIGTQVGILRAIDPNPAETHSFTLVEGDGDDGNAYFVIDGQALKSAAVFDQEEKSNYSIRVRATNSMGLFVETPFNIGITTAGDLDFAFDAGSINWPVYAAARQNDGKWIIGGTFTSVQNTSRGRLARLNSDGSLDHSFLDGLAGAANDVLAIAIQEDGKILIAGRFISINGRSRWRIARLHQDGSLDTRFLNDFEGVEGPSKTVWTIALQEDGKILIGGDFDTVNGEPRNGIARFTADGTLDESFVPSLSYLNWDTWSVSSIVVQPNGMILVAGSSQRTTGEAGPSLVRLWPSGSRERSFDITERIESVVLQDNGGILIGGSFTTVDGQPRNRVARLNWNGTLDTTFGDNVAGVGGGTAPRVHSIATQPSGKIVIGGSFSSVNGETRNNVARLNRDGSLDHTFGDGMTGANSTVHVVAPAGQDVLLAGSFRNINGVSRQRIAILEGGDRLVLTDTNVSENRQIGTTVGRFSVLDPALGSTHAFTLVDGKGDDGNADFSIEGDQLRTAALIDREEQESHTIRVRATGLDGIFVERVFYLDVISAPNGIAAGEVDLSFRASPDNQVYTATHLPDGKYIITGGFTRVQGIHSEHIARLNADGSFDHSFQYPFRGTIPRGVNAVALGAENKIFIGGGFSTVHGESRSRIARLYPDGSLDIAYGHDVGEIDRTVRALALQPDGKVLIGGEFTNVHGALRRRVARLETNGALDNSFGAGLAGANDTVNVIAVQNDGKILIGGRFTTVNEVPRNHFARLHSDGTLDDTFAPGLAGADGRVTAILVQPDDRVLLAGYFSTVHDHVRNGIARLQSDGSIDHSFAPATGEADVVNSLALQDDGEFLLAGGFTTVGGERKTVARLKADGAFDHSVNADTAGNPFRAVSTILIQDDGQILIAGSFSSVNGIVRPRVARLHGGTLPPSEILLDNYEVRDHQPIGTLVGALSTSDSSDAETHVYSLVPGEGDGGNQHFAITGDALKTASILDFGRHFQLPVRVRSENSLGLWAKQSFGVVIIPDPYRLWSEFLPQDERDPTDDPGGHGIPNLLRYAFGMDPLQPEREKLPQVERNKLIQEGQTEAYLVLTYTRRINDSMLVFSPEASGDLVSWLPFDGIEEITDDGNGETETVTVTDKEPLGHQAKRFLRLRIER